MTEQDQTLPKGVLRKRRTDQEARYNPSVGRLMPKLTAKERKNLTDEQRAERAKLYSQLKQDALREAGLIDRFPASEFSRLARAEQDAAKEAQKQARMEERRKKHAMPEHLKKTGNESARAAWIEARKTASRAKKKAACLVLKAASKTNDDAPSSRPLAMRTTRARALSA